MERQNQSRNPKLTGAKVGDILVGKPDTMAVGGRDRREQCFNVDTKLGEQISTENRKRVSVRFSMNSKSDENGKRSDIRRSCWIGSGLIVEVDVKGRRRFPGIAIKGE